MGRTSAPGSPLQAVCIRPWARLSSERRRSSISILRRGQISRSPASILFAMSITIHSTTLIRLRMLHTAPPLTTSTPRARKRLHQSHPRLRKVWGSRGTHPSATCRHLQGWLHKSFLQSGTLNTGAFRPCMSLLRYAPTLGTVHHLRTSLRPCCPHSRISALPGTLKRMLSQSIRRHTHRHRLLLTLQTSPTHEAGPTHTPRPRQTRLGTPPQVLQRLCPSRHTFPVYRLITHHKTPCPLT